MLPPLPPTRSRRQSETFAAQEKVKVDNDLLKAIRKYEDEGMAPIECRATGVRPT